MKEVIRVERKRILSLKNFLIILLIILGLSIFSSVSSLSNYSVYDSEGKIIIHSKENLKESKSNKHNKELDEKTLQDVINRTDKSRYLYNSNLIRLLITNYKDKNIEDITQSDIREFYNKRILNLKDVLKISHIKFTDKQISQLISNGEKLKEPLQIGYCEGWKNLNNDIVDFIPLILGLISIIVLPIFAQDPKTKMRQLYVSTKYGKKTLVKARVIAGIEIGTILYITSVFIFSFSKLLVFGVEGYNLPIQNSASYFLSTYNITYLQQYILNILIGFMAVLLIVAVTFLFTVVANQILSGAVLLAFFWIVMIILPDSFEISHYFSNFLPYNMTNFNRYYIGNEVYTILGNIIPSAIWVVVVSFAIFLLSIILVINISNIKLSSKLR